MTEVIEAKLDELVAAKDAEIARLMDKLARCSALVWEFDCGGAFDNTRQLSAARVRLLSAITADDDIVEVAGSKYVGNQKSKTTGHYMPDLEKIAEGLTL